MPKWKRKADIDRIKRVKQKVETRKMRSVVSPPVTPPRKVIDSSKLKSEPEVKPKREYAHREKKDVSRETKPKRSYRRRKKDED